MSSQQNWRGYTADSDRSKYLHKGYCRHGHPESYKGTAGYDWSNESFYSDITDAESSTGMAGYDWSNETFYSDLSSHHHGSCYGSRSSRFQDITDAESYTGMSGYDWSNETFYSDSSSHQHRHGCGSCYGSRSSRFKDITDAESYTGMAGSHYGNHYGNEACYRASNCHGCESRFRDINDEEYRKRIHQMDCRPHVPKINNKIPSAKEASSDHQRLLSRLDVYDLYELKISGDGNCQFRSISDQLYRTANNHKEVRKQIVDQLNAHPEFYAPYVPIPYHEYLKKISRLGEWGDHVTLQAAADWYGVRMFVLTSFKDTCYIEILPRQQKSEKVLFLSFWAEVHYNSIYPRGGLDSHVGEAGIKKKWWWSWKKYAQTK